MSQKTALKPNSLQGVAGSETSHAPCESTSEAKQAQADTALSQAPEHNWLLSHAGSFADDPFWDEMMEFIWEDRRKMDERYDDKE